MNSCFTKQYGKTLINAYMGTGLQRDYPNKRASIRKYSGRITPLGKNFFEVCVK